MSQAQRKRRIPSFYGIDDPAGYLEWEQQMERVFDGEYYSEQEKIGLVLRRFRGDAIQWWNYLYTKRERTGEPQVASWFELKYFMKEEFVSRNYRRKPMNQQQYRQRKQIPRCSYEVEVPKRCNKHEHVMQKLKSTLTEVINSFDYSRVSSQTGSTSSNAYEELTCLEPEKPSSLVSESQVVEENAAANEPSNVEAKESVEQPSNPQEQRSSPQDDVMEQLRSLEPSTIPQTPILHRRESENCFSQTSKKQPQGKYLESKQRMKPNLMSLGAEHTILRTTLCKGWDNSEPTRKHSAVVSCPENSFDVGAFKVAYLSNHEELGNEAGCYGKLTHQSSFKKWFHHNDFQDLKVMDFTIWLIQDLRRMDPAVFKGAYLTNQEEFRCKLNSYGFSTHQGIFTNWNHQNIFSEQRDIEFTTWANQICRRTDMSSLRRELRPNHEASSNNSKCFGFLSHKWTMSKWKHLKRSWDELVMNFQSQQTFSLSGFQVSKFETLQSYIWRPGEFSKLFSYMFKDSLNFKYTDMSRLPLSKALNAGVEKGVERTRRLYKQEEDGRFIPPDLNRGKHQDINRSMLEKEAPPDLNLKPKPNEDLRANLLKGGGNDAIWHGHPAQMELIGLIYEVLDREKLIDSRQIMMGFNIMKKSDLDKFWSTRGKAHQAKPKYSRIIYQSDGNSESYDHAKGLVEMFIKSTYIFNFLALLFPFSFRKGILENPSCVLFLFKAF